MDSNANVSRIAQKYKRYNNDVIAATGLCNMCVTAKRKERRKAEEKGLETRGNTQIENLSICNITLCNINTSCCSSSCNKTFTPYQEGMLVTLHMQEMARTQNQRDRLQKQDACTSVQYVSTYRQIRMQKNHRQQPNSTLHTFRESHQVYLNEMNKRRCKPWLDHRFTRYILGQA